MPSTPSAPRIANSFVLFFVSTTFAILTPVLLWAQTPSESDISLKFGGLLHGEASYGWIVDDQASNERSRVGFGLHRTRLRATARLGPKFGAFIHLDADNGTFGVLDAFASYDASPRVRVRVGRMISAMPRAFILTPLFAMDALDRASIALRWGAITLGNKGRDYGVDLRYATDHAEATIFLHNGFGSFDRVRGNYQEGIVGDVTGGADRKPKDLAVSFYGAVRPVSGVEVGGFAGYNGSRNPTTEVTGIGRRYVSYSAHAYWGAEPGSQPIRLKADLVGINFEKRGAIDAQNVLGLAFLGAFAVHRAAELFARVETFDPNLDTDGTRDLYGTAGFSFSPSRLRGRPYGQERLTFAYSARLPENDDTPQHHLLQLLLQVNFQQ
ncbi:MAG: hypothetical protein WD275_09590 [Rhodothermales bacterium]